MDLFAQISDLLFMHELSKFVIFFNFFFKIVDLFALIVKILDLLFMREFSKCLTFLKILDLSQNCGPFRANCQNFGLTIYAWILKNFDLFKIVVFFQNYRPFGINRQNFGPTLYAWILKTFDLFQNYGPFPKLWTFSH